MDPQQFVGMTGTLYVKKGVMFLCALLCVLAELEPALARSFADVPALPGVERTIAHLHQHGVKIAVATSASREHFDIKASKHRTPTENDCV